MSYQLRFTKKALDDIKRLFRFLARVDQKAAVRAREAIEKNMAQLREFPWSCRLLDVDDPTLREFIVPFGRLGYICLCRIDERRQTITVLAIRHQREEDYDPA